MSAMEGLRGRELAVADAVDVLALLRDLADLVELAPVDGEEGEAAAQRWCAARLRELDVDVDEWDTPIDDLLESEGFPGVEVARDRLHGCVGVLGGSAEPASTTPTLALYGHTDVVPAGNPEGWSTDPFRLRVSNGIVTGRGTADMLGGVAAILGAVQAVRAAGVAPAHPVAIHLVSAEEDGGAGAWDLLRRGHLAHTAVMAEPTSATVIPANAGSLTFRIEVDGRATHGATRLRGFSALEAFEHLHLALRELEVTRNEVSAPLFDHLDLPWPLSVGRVRAGDWASTVPDLLIAEGRYGVRPGESTAEAKKAFELAIELACAEHAWLVRHPARISWPGGSFAPAATPRTHPLVSGVLDVAQEVLGALPHVVGAPYGSDLRHYAAHGIPAVQYGPGEVEIAHGQDEHVLLGDLVAFARLYAVLITRATTSPSVWP
jgi:acetylornithine deacetylase